MGGWNF